MFLYSLLGAAFIAFLWVSYRARTTSLVELEGAPDSIGTWKLYVTLVSTSAGGGMIFGMVQFGQTAGTLGWIVGFAYSFAFLAIGLLAPAIRRRCKTLMAEEEGAKDAFDRRSSSDSISQDLVPDPDHLHYCLRGLPRSGNCVALTCVFRGSRSFDTRPDDRDRDGHTSFSVMSPWEVFEPSWRPRPCNSGSSPSRSL